MVAGRKGGITCTVKPPFHQPPTTFYLSPSVIILWGDITAKERALCYTDQPEKKAIQKRRSTQCYFLRASGRSALPKLPAR